MWWNYLLTPKNQSFSLKKMRLKMSSVKWRPFCTGKDELTPISVTASSQWWLFFSYIMLIAMHVVTYPCCDYSNYISLTHRGRVTRICVGKLTIIGSDNGLSLGRRQAIIWTNAGILLFGPLGSNFSEILIEIDIFSFKKMHLKLPSAKWRPFWLGLNVLNGAHGMILHV